MRPTAYYERDGFVANAVFPTANIEQGKTLLAYYGAADTFTGVVDFWCVDVLTALR